MDARRGEVPLSGGAFRNRVIGQLLRLCRVQFRDRHLLRLDEESLHEVFTKVVAVSTSRSSRPSYSGEAVAAFVSVRQGPRVDEGEMIAFARERLASYKVPKRIEFVDELPKNANGKILRRELTVDGRGD